MPTNDGEDVFPFAGMTDEEVHAELLRRGISEQMIEKADARVVKAIGEARVRAELDRIGAELGFNLGSRSCPKCGGPMIHTRLNGYVCATRRCDP